MFYALSRQHSHIHVMPMPYDSDIVELLRFSAYVMVRYENFVEFVSLEERELMEPIHKISQTEPIVSIQNDVDMHRFMFVATTSNIHLYDCDGLLQNQYNYLKNQVTGCVIVRKLLTDHNQRKGDPIKNFQAFHNVVMVRYESGVTDILYTRDLMLAYIHKDLQMFEAPLRLI